MPNLVLLCICISCLVVGIMGALAYGLLKAPSKVFGGFTKNWMLAIIGVVLSFNIIWMVECFCGYTADSVFDGNTKLLLVFAFMLLVAILHIRLISQTSELTHIAGGVWTKLQHVVICVWMICVLPVIVHFIFYVCGSTPPSWIGPCLVVSAFAFGGLLLVYTASQTIYLCYRLESVGLELEALTKDCNPKAALSVSRLKLLILVSTVADIAGYSIHVYGYIFHSQYGPLADLLTSTVMSIHPFALLCVFAQMKVASTASLEVNQILTESVIDSIVRDSFSSGINFASSTVENELHEILEL